MLDQRETDKILAEQARMELIQLARRWATCPLSPEDEEDLWVSWREWFREKEARSKPEAD